MDLKQYVGSAPTPIGTSFQICHQCKISHPPIAPGEKCPLAKDVSGDGSVIDPSMFLNQLKIITVNQIKSKDIKDKNKLFGQMILNVTKFLENYQE